nr:uncharacterized protein LOC114083731 [Marmota flaviventris]
MTPGPLLQLANTVAEVGKAKPYGTGWEARQAVKTLSQHQPPPPLPPPPPPQAGPCTYTEQGAELPRPTPANPVCCAALHVLPGSRPQGRKCPAGQKPPAQPAGTSASGRLHSPGFPALWEAARRASGWPWEWERNAGAWTRRGRRGDVLPQTKRTAERGFPQNSRIKGQEGGSKIRVQPSSEAKERPGKVKYCREWRTYPQLRSGLKTNRGGSSPNKPFTILSSPALSHPATLLLFSSKYPSIGQAVTRNTGYPS